MLKLTAVQLPYAGNPQLAAEGGVCCATQQLFYQMRLRAYDVPQQNNPRQ